MTQDSLKLSIIIPTFIADQELQLCLGSLKRNSRVQDDILVIVDPDKDGRVSPEVLRTLENCGERFVINDRNLGPYGSWNRGAALISGDVLVFATDDQYFAPDWDINLIKHLTHGRLLTCQLVEPGVIGVWKTNIRYDCGDTAKTFDEEKFLKLVERRKRATLLEGGFFIPLVMYRDTFFKVGMFPDLGNFVDANVPNDVLFVNKAKQLGIELMRVGDSFSYPFQARSWMRTRRPSRLHRVLINSPVHPYALKARHLASRILKSLREERTA